MDPSTINYFETSKQVIQAKSAIADAYKLIFDSLYGSLNEIALEATSDPDLAKEIIHDCWIALIEDGIKKTFDYTAIQSFLFEKIRNASDSYINERQYIQTVNLDNLSNPQEEKDIIQALVDSFNELPEHRKELLEDALLNGTSSKILAAKYKIKVKKVLNLKNYSLKLLRKALFNKIQ